MLSQLGAQVEALTSADEWTRWLHCAAKFHEYSLNNQRLILSQGQLVERVRYADDDSTGVLFRIAHGDPATRCRVADARHHGGRLAVRPP